MSDALPNVEPPLVASPIADRRRLLIDLASSYALSIARVASMAAIVAILFRYTNAQYAATFILIRTIFGLLNSLFSGVSPTAQRALAGIPGAESARVYASASHASLLPAIALCPLVVLYALNFDSIHTVAITQSHLAAEFAFSYGLGLLVRVTTEPASAAIQSRGYLWLDNALLILVELAWPIAAIAIVHEATNTPDRFVAVARLFLGLGVAMTVLRVFLARWIIGFGPRRPISAGSPRLVEVSRLMRTYGLTAVASFADFLYAPASLIILSTFVAPAAIADYTPALQFDAALLLLVGAIAATMLPRAMRLAGERRDAELRSLYVRSTLISLAILAVAAIAVWLTAPTILRLWLGQPMPVTLSILPLVLLHTVIGGTAGVGRATLLAMGRFRAYTISAVLGGLLNVGLALFFVVGLGWGLRGVALATVIAVFARCAVWMPWYVLRCLRTDADRPASLSNPRGSI